MGTIAQGAPDNTISQKLFYILLSREAGDSIQHFAELISTVTTVSKVIFDLLGGTQLNA